MEKAARASPPKNSEARYLNGTKFAWPHVIAFSLPWISFLFLESLGKTAPFSGQLASQSGTDRLIESIRM